MVVPRSDQPMMTDSSRGAIWRIDYSGIQEFFRNLKDDEFVVLSVEPPWSKCAELFPNKPRKVILVQSLEERTLEGYIRELGDFGRVVVGVGGGTAIDAAKYVSLKGGAKLFTVPTVLSVNAFLSWKIALRREGMVNYIGDVYPEAVIIDLPIVRGAPPRLNRAGVGDIYSARTSLVPHLQR